MTMVEAVLLTLVVLATWLGAAGFARLRTPMDRMHCVTFVNVAAGLPLVVAALLSDGGSTRCGKILLIVVVNLLTGAAMSHAVGRALLVRDADPAAEPPAGGHG